MLAWSWERAWWCWESERYSASEGIVAVWVVILCRSSRVLGPGALRWCAYALGAGSRLDLGEWIAAFVPDVRWCWRLSVSK